MTGSPNEAAPCVSVIVPAYGTAPLIGDTIRSVLAQTFQDFEIIVINDGSPDTPALERALAPYRDRIIYLVQENRGISAARNAGIRVARGRYIALLDSDDVWEPEYLSAQLSVMQSNPGLAVVYSDALIVGDHPHAGRRFMEVCPSRGEPTFRNVVTLQCIVFVSALVRRDAIVRVGLFDENLRSVEDYDLWLRLLAAGERIGYHRQVLARHLKRRGSLSADPTWMSQTVVQVLDKLDRTLDLTPDDREALRNQRAYFNASLDLNKGKQAFFRLDTAAAVQYIERANEYFKSPRLRIVCTLMRTFPNTLLRLYRLRDRLIVGADTSF